MFFDIDRFKSVIFKYYSLIISFKRGKMKYTIFLYALFAISLVTLIAVIKPLPTGFAVQENMPLIEKVEKPCFCAEGENSEIQIAEQQKAYYSIVTSAEEGVKRKEISEKTAIRVLNNYAEGSCDKCLNSE